jgi:hypothetical protein
MPGFRFEWKTATAVVVSCNEAGQTSTQSASRAQKQLKSGKVDSVGRVWEMKASILISKRFATQIVDGIDCPTKPGGHLLVTAEHQVVDGLLE